MPVQFTTNSQRTSPSAVRTPLTVPFSVSTFSTGEFCSSVAPFIRAPFTSAIVTSTGLMRPSPGQ